MSVSNGVLLRPLKQYFNHFTIRYKLLGVAMAAENKAEAHDENGGEEEVHEDEGAGIFGNGDVEMHIDLTQEKKELIEAQLCIPSQTPARLPQLTSELEELAHMVANCYHCARQNGNDGGLRTHVLEQRIMTFGSARLKQFWLEKASTRTLPGKGYIEAVPPKMRSIFRAYRNQALAKMDAAKMKYEVTVDDIKRAEEVVKRLILSPKDKKQFKCTYLIPEIRELAQVAAKCLYHERRDGNEGGVPGHLMHARIATSGSTKLKQFWQKKSSLISVCQHGHLRAVPATKRALFREYRDELLAKMNSKRGAVNVEDFDKEWTIRISKSQGNNSVDTQQKGNVDGSDVEGQENNVSNEDTAKMPIHVVTKENEFPAIDHHVWLGPATKPQIANDYAPDPVITRGASNDMGTTDGILNPSQPLDGSTSIMSPDLEELARLVVECMDASSNKVCHETLARKVLSSECQMLKDRWNGMARLPRFQRDGYSMLIPRFMREAFQIHLISILNNGIKGQSTETPDENQNAKPTRQLKEPPPGATPLPQNKTIQELGETATIHDLGVPTKYQTADDIECWDMSGDPLADGFPAADDEKVSEAAEAATKHKHRNEEEPSSMKRLKTGPVPAAPVVLSKSIEDCKHAIRVFFKWRHRRLDLAQEQFLDESKRGWQVVVVGNNVDRTKQNVTKHHDIELDKLADLTKRCCACYPVGSSHWLLNESFFEDASKNWKAFWIEELNAWGSFGSQFCAEISERKQRDRYRIFLDAEKAWVQRHLDIM